MNALRNALPFDVSIPNQETEAALLDSRLGRDLESFDSADDLFNSGKDLNKLQELVKLLIAQEPLEEKYRDHSLTGNWADSRDCHIEPDWLLIYRIADSTLYLERTGSHSDLFK